MELSGGQGVLSSRASSAERPEPSFGTLVISLAAIPGELVVARSGVNQAPRHVQTRPRWSGSLAPGAAIRTCRRRPAGPGRPGLAGGRPDASSGWFGPEEGAGRLRRPEGAAGATGTGADLTSTRRPDRLGLGHALAGGFRVTDATKSVVVLSRAVRRQRVNSTLKSLLFWMVLVVVGVLVWNFSTQFQQQRPGHQLQHFMTQVETGQVVQRHDHRQRDHRRH